MTDLEAPALSPSGVSLRERVQGLINRIDVCHENFGRGSFIITDETTRLLRDVVDHLTAHAEALQQIREENVKLRAELTEARELYEANHG